jgi:hypothetical protein
MGNYITVSNALHSKNKKEFLDPKIPPGNSESGWPDSPENTGPYTVQ